MIRKSTNVKLSITRQIKEFLFRIVTSLSLFFAVAMVFILIGSVAVKGYTAFFTNYLVLSLDKEHHNTESAIKSIKNQLQNNVNSDIKVLISNLDINDLISGIEFANYTNIINTANNTQSIEKNFLLVSNLDMYLKGYINRHEIDPNLANIVDVLKANGVIKARFNKEFFTNPDSRYSENAGIKGAAVGSLYVVLLTTLFSVILSVGTAIYLEEFASKRSKLVSIIDININNLAAVPSIIFGLLGLIIFENMFGVPRGTPLLASLILTLMALPTIIITTKIALASVPKIVKEASYGLGASKLQVILLHSLPMSLPGILTGVIISVSRIIGETAPLLMIGMVSFTNNIPSGILDSALVFPVQILLWFNNPEPGYAEKASGAILLLLAILLLINLLNSVLRNNFEKKYK